MGSDQDSLFSLELVIEKLYLPHTVCRFPAVAFRLLDFPTIVIKHVEDELGQAIKRKISMDPYYDLPNQFDELKDKHGNFMIKKGKSCLFKISANAMRAHLQSTPLYMMILDCFPDVTKLVGNSSIPLDAVIEAIHADINKLGNSIPSVHGDKGLFKVYNLMGKEIGYVVLGYRLLSLGPGLIPHIPESAISNRMSEVSETMVAKKDNTLHTVKPAFQRKEDEILPDDLQNALNTTREIGSMTDVEKCDGGMQTIEMCDKDINVDLLNEKNVKDNKTMKNNCQTSSTQTDKKPKNRSAPKLKADHIIDANKKEIDDDDDGAVIIANVIRPPPLFYNRKMEPPEDRHTARTTVTYSFDDDDTTSVEDDITVENLSDDESIQVPQDSHTVVSNRRISEMNKKNKNQTIKQDFGKPQAAHPKTTVISHPQQQQTDHIYPLLTALLDELISLKDQRRAPVSTRPQHDVQSLQPSRPVTAQTKAASAQNKSVENAPATDSNTKDAHETKHASQGKKSHRKCAHPSPGVPKFKGWIRQAPEYGVKKSKLVFGLTNTQRLRLAKGNPDWLKSTEKEVKEAKAQKQKSKDKKDSDHDLDLGNLSDTLTEVRRLASRELNETQVTLDTQFTLNQSLHSRKGRKVSPRRKNESKTGKKIEVSRKPSKSPKLQRKKYKNVAADVKKEASDTCRREDSGEFVGDLKQSHSQRSIEVKLPKTEIAHSDEDSDYAVPSSNKQTKFPGFIDKNTTLPDTIDGRSDLSLDISISSSEESPPLESTRASKDYRPQIQESKMFQSTDDYDTKQFQSTDEPELQKLMSDDNYSEESDVEKTVRKSDASPTLVSNSITSHKFQVINPVASQQSPIPALRRSQVNINSLNAGPSATTTPRSRSSQSSSKRPTPRPRLKSQERRSEMKRDIHTESLSSYFPSEMDNLNTSITSDPNYSDDFQAGTDDESVSVGFSSPDLPILIPSTKLGYTVT